jgi:hypothetical protein
MGSLRLKKVLLWIGGFLVVFSIVGFFGLPPVIKSILTKKLSQALNRTVTVQSVRVNPFSLTLRIGGATIKEKSGSEAFLRFDELAVGLNPSSLVRQALILRRVVLKKPYVRVALHRDGSYNFSDLLVSQPPTVGGSDKKEPFRFSISNIQIMDGSIDFVDGPKDTTHTVRQMAVNVPFVSNVRHHTDVFVQPYFSANINGSPYVVKGKTKPFRESYESYVDINIVQLDLARYVSYIPRTPNFTLKSALLDVDGKLSFIVGKTPSLVISGTATFSDVVLDDLLKRPLLRLPSAVFVVDSLEPFKPSLHVLNATLKSPEVTLRKLENGKIDLATLIGDSEKPPQTVQTEAPTEKGKTDLSSDGETPSFKVDEFLVEGGAANFEDHAFAPPVSIALQNIAVRANSLSTVRNSTGNVALSFQTFKKGDVSTTGTLGLNPLSLDLGLDIKRLFISPFQPYFQDKVKIAVTRGNLSGSGKLVMKTEDSTGPTLGFTGVLFVSNFSSVDKIQGDPFLEWKNLSFTKIDFRLQPLRLHVGGVALTDFYSRIIINPDGSTNLHNIMGGEEGNEKQKEMQAQPPQPQPSSKVTAKNSPPQDVRINTITLQGGRVDFADRRIQPTYETELSELAGRVSNISLKPGAIAQLELLGKIEKHIPLKISGTINPSPKTLFVDLTASFHDLDLSPMTPYAAKYAGYTIEKGKLSIDVKYLVNDKKLDSQNLIFLDQFTFGDRVESPDATGLPVRLAVALLRDRNGQIKLDIPVSGSIDDPQFSIGRVILKIIVNLITKAATSPFSLLSSLFGGGEELGYVEFDYGASQIEGPNMKKIETLAKALYERPSLKLDVEGRVDVERDREALRRSFLMKKVKAQKLNDMLKQRQRPDTADDIRIEGPEYDKYLARAYSAEKFPKPRNIVGLAKNIPPSEMEKLMLTHIVVKDEDLRTLALQRARKVADVLLKSQNIPAERVFVIEPKSLTIEDKGDVKNSRVDFRLK